MCGRWRALLVFGLAVGCRFDVLGSWSTSAPAAPPDLAAAPPPAAPDLGDEADLGATPDLLSPCTRISDRFAADPTGRWALAGDASWDAAHQALQLTSVNFDVAGSAFWATPLYTPAFDARFDFRISDGSGADGLAFVFAKAASVGALVPFGNGQFNTGYGIGYLTMNGFAVELDTFPNFDRGDPNGNHVALVATASGTHLLTASPSSSLHGNGTRVAHIRFDGRHLLIELDGVKILDADLPKTTTFVPDSYFFGFTAAAGGLTDHHAIGAFNLVVGPGDLCF
jgi:hypothetical protein